MFQNPYMRGGLGLLIAGVIIIPVSFFIFHIDWLTALGICMIILSFIMIVLAKAVPSLPPEICGILMETGVDNIATLVEELGIKNKAIYIPSSFGGKCPKALIPLSSDGTIPGNINILSARLITRYGPGLEDLGLLVSTTGSVAVELLDEKPEGSHEGIGTALASLYSGKLGVADGVRVSGKGNEINIEIINTRLGSGADWSHQCLGSPLAAIAASVTAEAWNKPVTIVREEWNKRSHFIKLEVSG